MRRNTLSKKKNPAPTPTPEATPASGLSPATVKMLTPAQITQAATNDPALSDDSFTLGGKTYKYVHLSYDYYIEFLCKIKPLLAAVVGTVTAKDKSTVSIPGIDLVENPMASAVAFAGHDIPDMVRIIINNSLEAEGSEERITVADIKKIRGITPMTLTNIVMGQVTFNSMITEFASFFVQSMPLLKAVGILTSQAK
jgi:hypothetical protein